MTMDGSILRTHEYKRMWYPRGLITFQLTLALIEERALRREAEHRLTHNNENDLPDWLKCYALAVSMER
jgi:hypothetical protein